MNGRFLPLPGPDNAGRQAGGNEYEPGYESRYERATLIGQASVLPTSRALPRKRSGGSGPQILRAHAAVHAAGNVSGLASGEIVDRDPSHRTGHATGYARNRAAAHESGDGPNHDARHGSSRDPDCDAGHRSGETPRHDAGYGSGNAPSVDANQEAVHATGYGSSHDADHESDRDAGYAAGHAQGIESGLEAGRAMARQDAERAAQEARAQYETRLAAFDRLLDSLSRETADRLAAAEEEMAGLCFDVLCQILGTVMAGAAGIRAHLRNAISGWSRDAALTVLLHPADLALLAPEQDSAALPRNVRLQADASLVHGGCLVQSAQGGLDARLDRQLQNLCALLRRAAVEHEPDGEAGITT
jgi:flagellar assembly protein FliH